MDVMPVGYRVQVKGLKSTGGQGRFMWHVTRYGRTVGEGVEDSEQIARKVAGKVMLADAQKSAAKNANKNVARMKLRSLTENRPYLVAGALELMLNTDADLGLLLDEAESYEKTWHQKDPVKYRRPLPTHHRTLKPWKAAEQLVEVLEVLGFVEVVDGRVNTKPALRTWAVKTFGERVVTT